mmetsp:Transcript_29705/g.78281  ORF Transcript_29705/g.78281 Transcript_29705/m.78281 type:complete len:205 (-) Transcript_29705:1431-2045(-)
MRPPRDVTSPAWASCLRRLALESSSSQRSTLVARSTSHMAGTLSVSDWTSLSDVNMRSIESVSSMACSRPQRPMAWGEKVADMPNSADRPHAASSPAGASRTPSSTRAGALSTRCSRHDADWCWPAASVRVAAAASTSGMRRASALCSTAALASSVSSDDRCRAIISAMGSRQPDPGDVSTPLVSAPWSKRHSTASTSWFLTAT